MTYNQFCNHAQTLGALYTMEHLVHRQLWKIIFFNRFGEEVGSWDKNSGTHVFLINPKYWSDKEKASLINKQFL